MSVRDLANGCCSLRFAVWRFRISRGKATESKWFACEACGRVYFSGPAGWEHVIEQDGRADMAEHDPRGQESGSAPVRRPEEEDKE